MNLQTWLASSVEFQFLYGLKSEALCSWNVVESNLGSVTCDCVAPDSPKDSSCYLASSFTGSNGKDVLMGYTAACAGERTTAKDPSAYFTFNETSIFSGCLFVNISIIYQGWFSAPFVPPPLSFRWQHTRVQGVVVNSVGATVGSLLGDGLVLWFSNPSDVGTFHVCLLIQSETNPQQYPALDFGYSITPYTYILPLNLSNVSSVTNAHSTFWCSDLMLSKIPMENGTIHIFPIERKVDYSTISNDYTNSTTRDLMYILGAFYCFIGFCCLVMLILQAFYSNPTKTNSKLAKVRFPVVFTVVFLILCVFRAVFMFLYPKGTFENDSLSAFIVFEIPTFLLFTLVIYAIFIWKSINISKKFFPVHSTTLPIFGVAFVWSIWIIVTVVYAEVILNSTVTSNCPGRAEPSYEHMSSQIRTLTIAYQSTLIGITAILVGVFLFFTVLLVKASKQHHKSNQFVMVVGGVICFSFLLRCILFVILLAADFVSSVYLFITLMITEVIPMTILLIQFYRYHIQRAITHARSTMSSDRSETSSNSNSQV